MKTTTISAHFDGKQIILEEPHQLRPNARLLVTVLPDSTSDSSDAFISNWKELAASGLSAAYGPDEPNYPDSIIQEPNPEYGKR